MSTNDFDDSDLARWDPGFVEQARKFLTPFAKFWFRAEVRGLERVPRAGGALLVGNHSGGAVTPDVLVLAPAFYEALGYDRPLYTLAHYGLFKTPLADTLRRIGVIGASRDNAAMALNSGGVVLVFPGGDYDVYRPTARRNVIDFGGRTGYAEAAVKAGVPIVPAVTIGGQESQFYLTRGIKLARVLGLSGWEHRLFRSTLLPVTLGFPFGLSVLLPVNMPLPAKMVTELLPAIDIAREFGPDPDVDEVDDHVRRVMQRALDALAAERRFPILG